ncbi:MAG: transglutaminase-like domain-containing protein [Phycisphaerae bacterium]|jgi:hypothetical protein
MSGKRITIMAAFLVSVLSAAPVHAAEAPAPVAEQTDYYAVFADGSKIGQSVETRKVEGGKVTTTNRMEIVAGRGLMEIAVTQEVVSIETDKGRPLGFRSMQDMSLMSQEVEGAIDSGGMLTIVSKTGGGDDTRKMPWPSGAMLTEGLRLYRLSKGLAAGTTYSGTVFETTSLAPVKFETTVGPRKKINLLGRTVQATETTTVMSGPTGTVQTVEYLDDQARTLKSTLHSLGMSLEIISCSKEVAQSENGAVDFLSKTLLPSPQPLTGLAGARSATIVLLATRPGQLNVPTLPNQHVLPGVNGRLTVNVSAVPVPSGARFPYAGSDPLALAAMKPARYLESDRKEIIDLARQAVGNTTDAGEAARRIERFVHGYISTKDLSVGYATAAEAAASREGDCSEHAVLAAAMCRAVGIPAQVVAGMAYVPEFQEQRDVFGPHAWVRAFVGDRWINLDPTFPGGWDVAHIALASGDGNPADFLGMVNTLGDFKIAQVQLRR